MSRRRLAAVPLRILLLLACYSALGAASSPSTSTPPTSSLPSSSSTFPHSSSTPSTSFPNRPPYSPATWMTDLYSVLENRTLLTMTFPGTHDSGTANLTTHLIPGYEHDAEVIINITTHLGLNPIPFVHDWATSQDKTIEEQLYDGIRFFDLRAGWNGSEWVDYHMLAGLPLQTYFDELLAFLQTHPKELIMGRIVNFVGSATIDQQNDLARAVVDTFGSLLINTSIDLQSVTVGELVSANTRLLFTFENSLAIFYPTLWTNDKIENSYANSPVLDKMMDFNTDIVTTFNTAPSQSTTYSNKGPLFLMSWTLTPNTATIIEALAGHGPGTLLNLAAEANAKLGSWYLTTVVPHRYCLTNVFIIDHYEMSSVLDIVIDAMLSCKWPTVH